MLRTLAIVLCTAAIARADDPHKPATPAPGQAPAPAAPASSDFQLAWATFGPGEEPAAVYHLLATAGKVYELRADSKEVIVYDGPAKVIRVFNLRLKRKAEIGDAALDERVAKLRRESLEEAADLEKRTGRADRVEGEMTRSLVEPRYRASFDESMHRLRLSNASVEIDANGTHEDDPARLAVLGSALLKAAKLRTIREPDDLRQLTEIDVLSTLIGEHKLRPTRVTYLFRLAGRPVKIRRVYEEPSPALSDLKRITQVEELLGQAKTMKLEDFDRMIDVEDVKD
jgi:hypothetical protein